MTNRTEREETFYRGEYLEAFANYLVANEHGGMRREGNMRSYDFSHSNLDNLRVSVTREDEDFHSVSCDVTLRGPREQIREFIRAAGRVLDNSLHSREMVEKQLKEVKKYKNVLRKVNFDEVGKRIGKPFLMTSSPADSEVPLGANIGYLGENPYSCKSFLIRGCNLTRPYWKLSDGAVVHNIGGVKYIGNTRNGSLVYEGANCKYFTVESKNFDELIERIEDGRPVFIS